MSNSERSEFFSVTENELAFQHFAYRDACFFPARRLPEFAIVCCFQGQIDVTENHCRTILHPGEILVGNPGLIRGSKYLPEGSRCEGATIVATSQFFTSLLTEQRLAPHGQNALIAGKIHSPSLTQLLLNAVAHMEQRRDGYRSYVDALLRQCLVQLLWDWPRAGILTSSRKDGQLISRRHFVHAMEYMNRTPKCDFSVDTLCHQIGMSQPNFRRLLYRSAQTGPLELYNKVLQQRTEQLLQKGLRPKEVSYELGFASPSQFAKFFRLNKGMPPSQFQEQLTGSLQYPALPEPLDSPRK